MKERLIHKLLETAKRHKILTYPVLALVALISVISYFFSWSTGAGKRVVAVVLALVMLVSQSYFLTSSATGLVDDSASVAEQMRLQDESGQTQNTELVSSEAAEPASEQETTAAASETGTQETDTQEQSTEAASEHATEATAATAAGQENENVFLPESFDPENNGDAQEGDIEVPFQFVTDSGTGLSTVAMVQVTYNTITKSYDAQDVAAAFTSADNGLVNLASSNSGCYRYDGWYKDSACTQSVSKDTITPSDPVLNTATGIMLYSKKTLVKYKVSILMDEGVTLSVSGTDIATEDGNNVYYVAATGDESNPSGSFTILNPTRVGYTIKGATVTTGGSGLVDGDKNVQVTLSGTSYEKTVQLDWNAESYDVRYATSDDSTQNIVTRTLTFDSATAAFESQDIAKKKPGWKFKAWEVIKSDGVVYGEYGEGAGISGELQKYLFENKANSNVYIRPVYVRKTIELNQSTLTYEYATAATSKTTIVGQYTENNGTENKDFQYKISDDQREALLNQYGIIASPDGTGGITFSTDGPTKVGTITIDIVIIDPNKKQDEADSRFPVQITVNKKIIKPVAPTDGSNNKTYDGTDTTKLTGSTLETNVSGVTISYTRAYYDSANAGNRNIMLEGATLTGSSVDSSLYQLCSAADCKIEGKINKRFVFIKTQANLNGRDYIRSGEANPEFQVIEDKNSSTTDSGLLDGETLKSEDMEFYTKPERNDNNLYVHQDTEYQIYVKASSTSNYDFKLDVNAVGTFIVKEESPEGSYKINGVEGENGWYKQDDVSVVPDTKAVGAFDGYDQIRLSTDGGNTYTEWSSVASVTEALSKAGNTSICVQLKSSSGAVTAWSTPLNLKVDTTAPVSTGFILSKDGAQLDGTYPGTEAVAQGGLYFPSVGRTLTFGNYFNTTVDVTISCTDETSGPGKLYYGLDDTASDGTAVYNGTQATFELSKVVLNKTGRIYFYSEDQAGNKEAVQILKKDGEEWSVEQNGPTVSAISVKAGKDQNKTVVSGSDAYYANCKAYLTVEDAVSGIYGVTWYVNGTAHESRVSDTGKRVNADSFVLDINDSKDVNGQYELYAVVEDNAGNKVRVPAGEDTFNFKVDDVAPEVSITNDYDKWDTAAKVTFTAKDDLSGVEYITVKDPADHDIIFDYTKTDGVYDCSFETTIKGTYTIEVTDYAGNVTAIPITLDKVSNQVPECPEVTVTPDAPNENGWYKERPAVTFTNIGKMQGNDSTPVYTRYQLSKEGESSYNETTIDTENTTITIPPTGTADGVYNMKVWSISKTGVSCADTHTYQFKVDTTKPSISVTPEKGSGSTIVLRFNITDTGSGIDPDTIVFKHGSRELKPKIEETGNGYSGSLEISEVGSYTIEVSDLAGNVSDKEAFTPMSMKVRAIKNISASSATVGAVITKGTYPVTAATIACRKLTDTEYKDYTSVPAVDANGNWNVSAVLDQLEEGTAYAYKITAVSEADEILEYEGYFRTLSNADSGIAVSGTAGYLDGRDGKITVGLYAGNTCVKAMEIDAGGTYSFSNIADGSYNILATDGVFSKTVRLVVKDGNVIYPETAGALDLQLSGRNTSVVITSPDTPDISADNLDSLFNDITNYTDEDRSLVDDGNGMVEFRLVASLVPVTSVQAGAVSALYATVNNKIVGAYLELSLHKLVTDAEGNVTDSLVSDIGGGSNVSVTIPLGELAGKPGLEVVRIHQNGDNFTGAVLQDQDSNPNTFTVVTTQFSVYAIVYDQERTTQENTEATDKQNKTKTGTAVKTNQNAVAATSDVALNTNTTYNAENPSVSGNASVGSLRSAGSAKTGDAAPVTAVCMLMFLSLTGIVVMKRKQNKIK